MIFLLEVNFNQIIEMIEKRKTNAYRKVNEELILLYYEIGEYLFDLIEHSDYGDKIITNVVEFMHQQQPNLKGFNKRNLERMVQFYKTYKDDKIASPVVTQLSWTHNLLILSSTKTKEERHFYLNLCIKENYSKRELERQIKSSYYERYMLSEPIMKSEKQDEFSMPKILDLYSLEFLNLPSKYSESDLKKAIIENMKSFILEIGKDFTFIQEEYKVKVGNHDFYIDLLFYNRALSCLVAFELKIGEFKAEYLGKMNLYLEALDKTLKKPQENPSVGIILCSSKDKEVVKYTLNKNLSKTKISEYKLKLIDKKLLENKLIEMKKVYFE